LAPNKIKVYKPSRIEREAAKILEKSPWH